MNSEANLTMKHLRSTKGTHIYTSDLDDAICRQVYLMKDALPDRPPSTIELTVRWSAPPTPPTVKPTTEVSP